MGCENHRGLSCLRLTGAVKVVSERLRMEGCLEVMIAGGV